MPNDVTHNDYLVSLLNEIEPYWNAASKEEKCRFENTEDIIPELESLLEKGYSEAIIPLIARALPILPLEAAERSVVWYFTTFCASVSAEEAAARAHKRHLTFSKMPSGKITQIQYQDMQMKERYSKRNRTKRDDDFIRYQKNLQQLLQMMKTTTIMPEKIDDILLAPKPEALNRMADCIPHLFGVLDGGIAGTIRDIPISDHTWLCAIELSLTSMGMAKEHINDMNILEFGELEELADNIYEVVVCYGLLIHTIRLLSTDPMLRKLYEEEYDRNKQANEQKAFRQEITSLKEKINSLSKANSELERKIKLLQSKPETGRKTDKQIPKLVHQHNNELKGKDRQISQLQERIEQLENERMNLEHSMMIADEKSLTDRPWLEMELPENNVVFLGGHQNMCKKLQEKYRGWYFISTDNSNASLPANPVAIFVWSGHLSHHLWFRINDFYQGREKMSYVQSTNIARLEEEMKHGLWKIQTGRS